MFQKLHTHPSVIQTLRLRLTILCSVVSALILAVLTFFCLFLSETGSRRQEETTFQSGLNTIYQNLRQQTVISHNQIRQMEYSNQLYLRILDNGTPLFYQNYSEDKEGQALLDLAAETAASDYHIQMRNASAPISHIYHEEFPLENDHGGRFLASAALIRHNGGTLSVLAVHPLTRLQSRINSFRRAFLLTDLAALTVLTVFYWFFIQRILKPLLENQKKQTRFIANASHELRSPLTVIRSQVDAVKSGSIPADQQFLDVLTEESERMSHLVHDMLQLANADNHSWSMQFSVQELDTLVLQTWEAFEPLAGSKDLRWEIRLPEQSPVYCRCDADRIRQLLSILIDNAFSYTPSGGSVCLALETGSDIRVTVSDNGPGIPDDEKEAVFDRFYCMDSSRSHDMPQSGSSAISGMKKAHFGLGLSIAREIAALHKGKLLLTDTPGGGASFTLIL